MKNEEYLSYVDYLKSINFEEKLDVLKEKYTDKKIILFGMGSFLDAILNNYKITDYLNVIGISDKRVTQDASNAYNGFNVYAPRALRALQFNVILDTSVLFEDTKQYLTKNYFVKKSVKIENIIQFSICEKALYINNKINSFINYLILTGNIVKGIKYLIFCTNDELQAKINYIKKIRELHESDKPIKTAFICSDAIHDDFVELYNLLNFDSDFKLFPVLLIPENLLETDNIDDYKIKQYTEYLNSQHIEVIEAIDRTSGELTSLHAFKPDLIFYQKPIFIKDDFNPLKMSENALTFTIERFSENTDFDAMGSKYYRKQVSAMWKVFVLNSQDKNLYTEYTDTKNKDIVKCIDTSFSLGIVKFLKKCLK